MSGIRRQCGIAFSLLASTLIAGGASALEPAGSAGQVTKITLAQGPGGGRTLETKGLVYSGDEITTDSNGMAEIIFIDNTRIMVGPNSHVVLDSFVFESNKTAKSVVLDALKGVFRMITGRSKHSAYRIRLPGMSVKVHGTSLDVGAAGVDSYAVFYEGSGEGCNQASQCVPLDGGCRLYRASAGGGISTPGSLETQRVFFAHFSSMMGDQSAFGEDFRVNTADCAKPDPRLFGPPMENRSSRGTQLRRQPPPPATPSVQPGR